MIRTLLLITFVILSFNAQAAETFPKGDFSRLLPTGRSTVTQVIAPDTIGLQDGRIVNLTGLYFPDLYEPSGAGPLAQTAKRVLADMLLGQDVRLYQTKDKTTGRKNRMDHQIAHIVRASDDAWVQGTLLKLGLAQVQTVYTNVDMIKQMLDLEKQAIKRKRGLWSLSQYQVHTAKDMNKDTPINRFAIVKGKVESIANIRNTTYINFGKDYKTDFTIVIPPEYRQRFTKAGVNPQDWSGKRLQVRGWLEYYNGPTIEVDHPEQIVRY
jgi:endonuclease YncB( thermonuclease family)